MSTPARQSRTLTKLTARALRAIAPEAHAVDWFDAKTPGLALNVTPAGTRTWYFFYRARGAGKRVKIGRLSPVLDLGAARLEAHKLRARIETAGADPAGERQAERQAARTLTVFTVDHLAALFVTLHGKVLKRTWKDDHWRLARYVLPAWGARPVRAITRADVHALLDQIAADGKPIQANRVQALISKVFNFAIDRGHADQNPCYRMPKRAPESAREVVADDAALRALWTALDATVGDASAAIRLRLLTGQRGGEIHEMHWKDVDLAGAIWTIPAESAKNGRAHRVPLTAIPRTLLAQLHATRVAGEPRVFPGLYHQRLDLRALAAIHQGAYTWHDLRRTVATRLGGLGFSDDTIGRVLNHARRGVTGKIYNHHAYDAEKRTALEAWERELVRIVTSTPRPRAEVVPIAARRA